MSFIRSIRLLLSGACALSCLALLAPRASAQPTLKSIAIDGNLRDWVEIEANPLQTSLDADGSHFQDCSLSNDLDCEVQSSGRDLREFSWTYDEIYLYVRIGREGSSSNKEVFWHYMDLDGDELMEDGEPVFRVVHQGSNRETQADLFPYTASRPRGDAMVGADGFADGHDLPGSIESGAWWSETLLGGSESGHGFEARVSWGALGVPAGTPMNFHVSSSNSANPNNIAAQVDDNMGSLDRGLGTLAHLAAELGPDVEQLAGEAASIDAAFVLENSGTVSARFDLRLSGSLGLEAELFADFDLDGRPDESIAVDGESDGDFSGPGDSIASGWDLDGDARPETPELAPGERFGLVVRLTTRTGQAGSVDETRLEAWSDDGSRRVASAVIHTHVGALSLLRDQAARTQAGRPVVLPLQSCTTSIAGTFDLRTDGAAGHVIRLHRDAGCDGAADELLAEDLDGDGDWDRVLAGDSDGDGAPDGGPLGAGECHCFVLVVTPPAGAELGDSATIVVHAEDGAGTSATAELDLTVAPPAELEPDHLVSEGTQLRSGPDHSVTFPHVLRNNLDVSSAYEFTSEPPTNDRGWPVQVWSDPDGDGNLGDAERITRTPALAPNGGEMNLIVEVLVPANAGFETISRTVVTAVSEARPGVSAQAVDELEVSQIATYRDQLLTMPATRFAPCDTVWVEVSGLDPFRPNDDPYELVYANAEEAALRTVRPLTADDFGRATDSLLLDGSGGTGSWSLRLRTPSETVTSSGFTVEGQGRIRDLQPDRIMQPRSGRDLGVEATLLNTAESVTLVDTRLELLVLSPGADFYLRSDGSFAPYAGSELSLSVPVEPLSAGESRIVTRTFPSVDYPSDGLYPVRASWVDACDFIHHSLTTWVVVGSLAEICDNGIDDDGDGLADCDDPECVTTPPCVESDCGDGLDDDGDGLVDCEDPDCSGNPACPELCENGLDDDGDGLIDCNDPDCAEDPACTEVDCNDGRDDEGDGLVDCLDPDCYDDPACNPEADCDNGVDDDSDGSTDCDDADCLDDSACADGDRDDDGVPNGEDCAPTDPSSWSLPARLLLLVDRVQADDALLYWSSTGLPGGTVSRTQILHGLVSHLRADRGFDRASCPFGNVPADDQLLEARQPGEDEAFWYLVRDLNACGAGPWGLDSEGRAREILVACP